MQTKIQKTSFKTKRKQFYKNKNNSAYTYQLKRPKFPVPKYSLN